MKIAVCTLCINDWYQEIVKYGVKTIELYAKKHNYDFYICNDVYEKCTEKRDYPWYKIKAIQNILPKYDFVLWLDADGFVMQPEKSVQDFMLEWLPKEKDILISRDWNNPLNTGVMIIRNTPFVHSLLYEVWTNKENFDSSFHEQASLGEIYSNNRLNSKNKIEVLPLEKRNVFYSYWSEYKPNNIFFMHIARCAFDPCGFVYTMDTYCPIKMEEDKEGEFEDRLSWLSDYNRCRADIEAITKTNSRIRESTRSILYRERFYRDNIHEKIANTKLKKNL